MNYAIEGGKWVWVEKWKGWRSFQSQYAVGVEVYGSSKLTLEISQKLSGSASQNL